MALIDTIEKMKQRGLPEAEITTTLQEQGYSPEEIRGSLTQSNIQPASPQPTQEAMTTGPNNIQMQEMQPSVMPAAPPVQPMPVQQAPIPQEAAPQMQPAIPVQEPMPEQEMQPPQPMMAQEAEASQYEQYPQYGGGEYEQYLPSTSDTMTEIAEEIIDEKLRKLIREIGNIAEFKTDINSKIKSLSERIKRIEGVIDKMNAAILKKVSMYGENLEDIKSEITSTQESFSKIINPLIDKERKTRKKTNRKTKNKVGVEHYLKR